MEYIIALIAGILIIVVSCILIVKDVYVVKEYKKIKDGKSTKYESTIGKVICNAYTYRIERPAEKPDWGSAAPREIKVVTPIVEYYVGGKKFEGQNDTLTNGGEIPEGTEVRVWYKKDKPEDCILETQMNLTRRKR